MIRVRQHVPGFVEGVAPWVVSFPNEAAMLGDQRITSVVDALNLESGHICMSREGDLLMVDGINRLNGNRVWWVIGNILDADPPLTLPVWRAPE